ncbi:MAG: DUF819 family protein [Halioglobus sp.]|jgi:uncharacterized membrane protein
MQAIAWTLLFLLVPVGLLWLVHRQRWAERLGIIVLCYLAGLLAGNAGLIPAAAGPAQEGLTELTIVLALPMLLFTLDVRQWRSAAGRALLSMLFATTAVAVLATCLFFLFRGEDATGASHLAAMAVGVYTGGTPNLAAIKAGLDIPHSEYIVFHSLDTLVGASYLLLMLTVGVRLFRRVLRRAPPSQAAAPAPGESLDGDDLRPLVRRENLPQLLRAASLSLLVLLVSLGVSRLLGAALSVEDSSALLIVTLTSCGILLSLHPRVRQLALSYKLGMYLIYVFSFTVASMATLEDLRQVNTTVALFLFGTVAGSLLLHGLLCRLAGIDSDTFMVTSVAAVCSPPFVPMMARALGNPGAILSGMTTGIIGYALGNYLGISLALFLQGL